MDPYEVNYAEATFDKIKRDPDLLKLKEDLLNQERKSLPKIAGEIVLASTFVLAPLADKRIDKDLLLRSNRLQEIAESAAFGSEPLRFYPRNQIFCLLKLSRQALFYTECHTP